MSSARPATVEVDRIEADLPDWADLEVERVKAQLKRTIAGSGLSQREVERRLDWGEGYVSQILRGKVAFKFKHCFAVLAVIGVEPSRFFLELEPQPGSRRESPAAVSARSDDAAELRDQVERIVRELLTGRGAVAPNRPRSV